MISEGVPAADNSKHDSRIASRVGTRLPLYLGGTQRLLLAPEEICHDLPRLRRDGWVGAHSEGVEGVGAFSAAAMVAT